MATDGKIFEAALAQGSEPKYLRAISSDGKSVKVLASQFAKQTTQTQINTRVTTLEGEVDAVRTTIPSQLTQIGLKLGDLSDLETTDKTSAVAAINEVSTKVDELKDGEAYIFGETLVFRNFADARVISYTLML